MADVPSVQSVTVRNNAASRVRSPIAATARLWDRAALRVPSIQRGRRRALRRPDVLPGPQRALRERRRCVVRPRRSNRTRQRRAARCRTTHRSARATRRTRDRSARPPRPLRHTRRRRLPRAESRLRLREREFRLRVLSLPLREAVRERGTGTPSTLREERRGADRPAIRREAPS